MGRTPKQALRLGLLTSSEVWTAKVDGRPEAMFGLVITSALGGKGVPWMLGTDAIYRHPREMICHGEKVLRRWLDSTPSLSNYVSVDNARAIRVLRRWGCQIGWKVIMHGDTGFVSFTMER